MILTSILLLIYICSRDERTYGTWVTLKNIEAYENPDDGMNIKFIVRPGTHCSMGRELQISKVFGYKKIQCGHKEGWVIDYTNFYIINDDKPFLNQIPTQSKVIKYPSQSPEISLVIREPYEDMRKRSSATIAQSIPGESYTEMPTTDAHLRFNDPDHGFITPPAWLFKVSYNQDGKIESVIISPQKTERLSMKEAFALMLETTKKLQKAGWESFWKDKGEVYANDEKTLEAMKKCSQLANFWRAKSSFMAIIRVHCSRDNSYPDKKAYFMTMEIEELKDFAHEK